jgi:hypothetical protein
MKRVLLSVTVLVCALTASAQNVTHKYHFNGGLNEMYSLGPALTTACTTGTFASESLPVGLAKKTYRFEKGCGLVYNDATKNLIASGTYTIELYFRLDTVTGYKKLADFDSLKVDAGLYNQTGKIVLYPNFTSADSFVGAGVYQYVAITRDGSSKKMYINANGKTAGTYTDNTDLYKLGTAKLLTFFQDDKSTNTEQSKGAVAMIQISNYAIDSNTVKNNYTLLNHTLDVPAVETGTNKAQIYPNPATGDVHVMIGISCNYSICDLSGKTIATGTLKQGDNRIELGQLSRGMYLLNITANGGTERQTYKFVRQ